MPFVEGRRGRIHHHSWDAPEPEALVLLLHGLGEHLGLYDTLADRLTSANASVVALDHAGHGRSDGTRVLVEDVRHLVDDARTVLDLARREHPDLPVVVIGHSLGATVGLLLTESLPDAVAGLVLSGSNLVEHEALGALLDSGLDLLALRKDPSELSGNAEYVARVREDPLVWTGGIRPETLRALLEATRRTAALVAGGRPAVPTLVVHGDADDMAPVDGARRVAGLLPDARPAIFPGDRHNVLNDADRDRVHSVVAGFVREATTAWTTARDTARSSARTPHRETRIR